MLNKLKNISIPTPNTFLCSIYSKISSTDKFAFASGFICWLIAHVYMYMNSYFVYDSVQIFNTSNGIQNGRFLVGPILALFGHFQTPWVLGLVSAVIIGISVVFICKILSINTRMWMIIVAALTATSSTMYMNNYFLSSIPIYCLALLFSVLTVYFMDKGKLYPILSGLFLILSLGCYQAYLCTSVCLFLALLISKLIKMEKMSETIKLFFIGAFIYIAFTFIYYGIWELLMNITSVEPISYRGQDTITDNLFSDIFIRLIKTYAIGLISVIGNVSYPNGTLAIIRIGSVLNTALGILALLTSFIILHKNSKHPIRFLMTAILFLGYPLAGGLMYFISPYTLHGLMLFHSMVLTYFLISNIIYLHKISIKKNLSSIIQWVVAILCVVAIFINFTLGTAGYVKSATDDKSSLSFASRLVDQIESDPQIEVGSKVYIVAEKDWYFRDRLAPEGDDWRSVLVRFVAANTINGVPYIDSLIWYIEDNANYMQLKYSGDGLADSPYAENETVKNLPSFPSENCMVWVDDVLVVKL